MLAFLNVFVIIIVTDTIPTNVHYQMYIIIVTFRFDVNIIIYIPNTDIILIFILVIFSALFKIFCKQFNNFKIISAAVSIYSGVALLRYPQTNM